MVMSDILNRHPSTVIPDIVFGNPSAFPRHTRDFFSGHPSVLIFSKTHLPTGSPQGKSLAHYPGAALLGMVTPTVVPSPGLLSTESVPPTRRARSFMLTNPNPWGRFPWREKPRPLSRIKNVMSRLSSPDGRTTPRHAWRYFAGSPELRGTGRTPHFEKNFWFPQAIRR